LHQPFALIGSSTLLQEDGAINSMQFAQLWLPFGEFRYPTDDWDIFAAEAAGYVVAKMIGVATTAHVTPCKTERRETFVDHFWLSAICVTPPIKDP
jgi:hypothetical protein